MNTDLARPPARPLAVGITPMETRRDVVLHLAVRAEELGYDAVFVAEGWAHDAAVQLAEIAVRTSRIRIGTGVLNVWGRSAGTIAMLATSLSELSGGRFVLGLGAGSPQLAEGLHDVPFRSPVARLGTVTRQVRGLIDGERMAPSTPGGRRTLRLGVSAGSRVPIQLAALGPDAVRLCGEVADAWYPFLAPLSGLKEGGRLLEEGATRVGPDRSLPRVCPGIPTAVSSDPATARAMAWWWISFYLTSMGPLYGRTLRNLGFGDAVDAVLEGHGSGSDELPVGRAGPRRRAHAHRRRGDRPRRPGPVVRRGRRHARRRAAAGAQRRRAGPHPRGLASTLARRRRRRRVISG